MSGEMSGKNVDTAMTRAARSLPWYRRTLRWGQTNLAEIDPSRYDAAWWREHWRRTRVQGVIVNAGGIVAYYPSRFPLHRRAEALGDRDFYGEIVRAARAEGLAVLARMDSCRAGEHVYQAHSEWFTHDTDGKPYRSGDLYLACVNGDYFNGFIPDVLREIATRSHPDGFTDNSWSGVGQTQICYCPNCTARFRAAAGLDLPRRVDWDDQAYRRWVQWNYARRIEIWDMNNRITREAGGPHCLWVGMNSGDIVGQSRSFRDYKAICERAEIIMLDSQTRNNTRGFQANAEAGKLIHGLLGWDRLIPESTAMYQGGQPNFRLSAKPAPEVRLWAVEGFAGGIQPWWHHIGAHQEDRRQFHTAEPLWRWHADNEQYLVKRRPVATVGVVWSQQNIDFYGRNMPDERVMLSWRGAAEALLHARIPWLPVHADHIERDGADLAVLMLPSVGALSDAQCAAVRAFASRGGGVIASSETSRYDEWGQLRADFALADLFGVHATGEHLGTEQTPGARAWEAWEDHTYLRLSSPPLPRGEQGELTSRHEVLRGFEETDILPFGGRLEVVQPVRGAQVALTYVPPFPRGQPETVWMRQPRTDIPALILRETRAGSRVAYLPADIDRCYGRDHLPDHAQLLANLLRWAADGRIPLSVEGTGLIDCHLYRQPGRLILHLVNLTNPGAWRAPVSEFVPVGPLRVRVRLPSDMRAAAEEGLLAHYLVSDEVAPAVVTDGWAGFEVLTVVDHEVVVIE
jgi:hypothetical protein